MERRGGGGFEVMLWFFLVFPALVSSQTQAQFPCYSERSCVVSSSIGSADSVMDCCLIRRGASVRSQVADEGCSQCAVYGWKGELEVEVMGSEIVTLTIGYSTGQPPRSKQFTVEFDKNTLLVEPASLTLGVSDVNVTAQVIRDDVMSLQRFDITLVELNPNVERGQFFLSTLQIVIAAQEVPPSAISLEVSLTESQHTVMESASSLVVCVRAVNSLSRSTPSNLTQSVTVSISDTLGSAERSSDYSIQMNAITFTEVPSTKCASIVIEQDSLYENTETFMLSLTAPSNVTVNQSTATVSILDSDTVIILLLPPQPSSTVNENIGNVIVPYRVMGGISPGITVQFSALTMDGTAKATTDYIQVNSFINVTTGTINGTISVIITNDAIFETTETFQLVVTTMQERVAIVNGMVDIVIDDDDGVVNVQAPPLSIIEGAAGELCLSSTMDERASITVDISVNDTNAAEGIDYTLSKKRVTLNMTGSSQCITINTSTDNLVEGSETFTISLSATEPSVRFEPGNTFPVTIEDVPPPRIQVGFINTVYTVNEGDGSVKVCAEVYQTQPALSRPLKVTLKAEPLTAEANDFTVNSSDSAISPISRDACITILITMDTDAENTEQFEVTLSSDDPSVDLQRTRAVVNILDDDDDTIIDLPPVNDTISGDPVMTVPINAPSSVLGVSGVPSLCYEVHGDNDTYFNMISDQCLSVNAHYIAPDRNIPINVINEVAVVAGNKSINIVHISVSVVGCVATVGGSEVGVRYISPGVRVRRTASRVRIAVSSCRNESVVLWVVCGRQNVTVGSISMETDTIRLIVARGYSLLDTSHGLVGQFWNIPISLSPLNETNKFLITVSHPSSPQRKFVGDFYPFSWETLKIPCLYVGDRQAARSGLYPEADDSIIEGVYTDYMVTGRFVTEFAYSKFGDRS